MVQWLKYLWFSFRSWAAMETKRKESPGWWWVPVISAVRRLGVSRVVPYTPLGGSTNANTRSPHKATEAFLCPVAQHVGSCFSNKQRHWWWELNRFARICHLVGLFHDLGDVIFSCWKLQNLLFFFPSFLPSPSHSLSKIFNFFI